VVTWCSATAIFARFSRSPARRDGRCKGPVYFLMSGTDVSMGNEPHPAHVQQRTDREYAMNRRQLRMITFTLIFTVAAVFAQGATHAQTKEADESRASASSPRLSFFKKLGNAGSVFIFGSVDLQRGRLGVGNDNFGIQLAMPIRRGPALSTDSATRAGALNFTSPYGLLDYSSRSR
jgi:hypothetical protein